MQRCATYAVHALHRRIANALIGTTLRRDGNIERAVSLVERADSHVALDRVNALASCAELKLVQEFGAAVDAENFAAQFSQRQRLKTGAATEVQGLGETITKLKSVTRERVDGVAMGR